MKKIVNPLKLSLIALFAGVLAGQAQIANTWNGGTDANWSTAANWTPGPLNPGDSLLFAGNSNISPNNNDTAANTFYGDIVFDPTAGSFDLIGNEINFGSLIQNNSGSAQAIDLVLLLTNAVTVNTAVGDISIGLNAGGIIGTNMSLTKIGTGTLTLSNANFSGGMTVSNGSLVLKTDNPNGGFTYTNAGASILLTYGSWYSTRNFAFTADGSLGVNAGDKLYSDRGRYDCDGYVGSPGFKWTVIGDGRFQLAGGSGHVLAGSTEVTAPAVLSDINTGNAVISGLGTNVITVDYGAALRKNNGGIVLNPIVLNGGDGPDQNGALVANQEAYSGQPGYTVATFSNTITLLNNNGDTYFGAQTSAGNATGSSMAVAGNITGPGGLVKIGPNPLILSGTNTYGGSTTINAGTLQVGSPGALPNGPTNGSVSLNNTSKLDVNGFNATVNYLQDDGNKNDVVDNSSASPASLSLLNGGYVTGAVGNSGGGPLSIISSGSVYLLGANSYTGSNVVQSGTLQINVPTGTTGGLVSVADGATLQLDYEAANSSLQASSAYFNGPSSGVNLIVNLNHYPNPSKPVINATNGSGVVTINGTVNFSFQNIDNLSGGTIHLIKYTSLAGAGSFTQPSLGAGITATIVTNTSTKTIDLVVQQPILTWTGKTNDLWDFSTTNWIYTGVSQAYADGNPILFDDTSKTNTVNLTTTVAPTSVLVNTTNTYTFTGNGPLNGGQLTLSGSGKLVLVTTNASGYGNTIIAGGTLQVGNGGTIGSLGSGSVDDESTLAFNLANNVTVANTISGGGSVVNNNTNTLAMNNAGNTYSGGTVVNQGTLKLNVANTLGLPGTGVPTITVASGATLDLNGQYLGATNPVVISGAGAAGTLGALTSISGGGGMNLGYGNIGVNNLSLAGDAIIGNNACNWQIGNSGLGIRGNGHVLTMIMLNGTSLYLRQPAVTSPSQVIIGGGKVFFCENMNALGSAAVTLTNGGGFDTWNNNTGSGTGNPGLTIPNNVTVGIGGGTLNDDSPAYNGSHGNYDTYAGSFTLNANLTLNNNGQRGGGNSKITITGPVSGTGGIICSQAPTNISTLSGACTYTGNTVVNGGYLLLSGVQQGGGAFTNNDAAVMDVPAQTGYTTVPMSTLALGTINGATLSLSRLTSLSTSNAPVTATNLVLTGTNSILLPGIAFANAGDYPLVKYTTLSGGITNLALGVAGARGLPGILSNNVANHSIDLVVPGGSPEKWVGNVNNSWDISGTANWLYQAVGTTYNDGDAVTFDDSSSVTNVNIAATVSPSLIVVSNTVKAYTFTNSVIAGSGGLLKLGTNTLLLTNGVNTFTGGATISGGTLKMGNAASLGNSGMVTVNPNGALDLNGLTQNGLTVNIIGSGLNGNGTIINSGAGNDNCDPSIINMLGSATIGGPNTWNLRNGAKTLNCPTNAFSLTKVGGSTVKIVGATVSPSLGDIYILAGYLNFEGSSGFGDNTKTVYIGGSGTLGFYQTTVPFAKNLICSNGASIAGNSGLSGNTFNVINSTVSVVSGTLNIKNNYNNGIIFNGPITGPAAVWEEWNGYFTTYATNTFTGDLTINGVVTVAGNGSVGPINNIYVNNGSGSLVVKDNAVVRSQNLYLTQGVINGWGQPGILTVTGSGVVACTNINLSANQLISFSGRTDGTFNMLPGQTLNCSSGSKFVGNLNVVAGATIWPGGDGNYQTMTCSNAVNLTGGLVSMDVATTNKDLITVVGALNLTGQTTIRVNYASLTNGVYHLITFGSETGTAAANLKLALNGPHYAAHLSDSTTANTIDLVVTDNTIQPANTLTWAGDGGNNYWDPATSSDWLNGSTSSVFYYGDTVSFTDPGTNPIVTLPSVVTPASVTVNSTANYRFAGVGSITGNAGLTKTNTGTLVINTANSFTGGTLINGGAVVMGNSGALWNNTNSFVTVTNGATLDFAGFNPNSINISVSGAGVGGNGALIANYSGAGVANGPAVISLLGNTTIGGTNRWDLRNGSNQLTAPVTGCTLTKVGIGYTALVGTAVSTNLGDIYVLGGTLGYQTGTTGLGNPTNTLYIGTNGTLEMYQASVPLNKSIVCSNGATILPDNGGGGSGTTITAQNIISGPIYLAGPNGVSNPAQINCNYYNGCAISNTISGPGGLLFNYNAYNRLYAPNTYSGDTTVYGGVYLFANSCIVSTNNIYQNGGPLFLTNNTYVNSTYLHDNIGAVIVGGSATILSTNLWFNGGAYLDVSGRTDSTLTLAYGQSLRGDTGSYIKGNVIATSGSSITPGGSGSTQTMVCSNNLTLQAGSMTYLDVSRNAGTLTSDLINVSNLVTFAGTLVISNAGPNFLGVGDTFTVFKAASFSGSLLGSLVSQTPWQTVTWTTTATPGQIQVATATTNTPTMSAVASGSNLSLSWPASFIGGTVQTNSVSLVSPTSWHNYPTPAYATNLNITIDPTQTNVFYRLTHQ